METRKKSNEIIKNNDIVKHIFDFLEFKDIRSFRFVCNNWNNSINSLIQQAAKQIYYTPTQFAQGGTFKPKILSTQIIESFKACEEVKLFRSKYQAFEYGRSQYGHSSQAAIFTIFRVQCLQNPAILKMKANRIQLDNESIVEYCETRRENVIPQSAKQHVIADHANFLVSTSINNYRGFKNYDIKIKAAAAAAYFLCFLIFIEIFRSSPKPLSLESLLALSVVFMHIFSTLIRTSDKVICAVSRKLIERNQNHFFSGRNAPAIRNTQNEQKEENLENKAITQSGTPSSVSLSLNENPRS